MKMSKTGVNRQVFLYIKLRSHEERMRSALECN